MQANIKIRHYVLMILLLLVIIVKVVPHAGEWYAVNLYPLISYLLSAIGSIIPFSIDELVVTGSITGLIAFPFFAWKKMKARRIIAIEAESVLWLYTWFYLGWACNYSRDNFYTRMDISPCEYDKTEFLEFLNDYTDSINHYYISVSTIDKADIEEEIKTIYQTLPQSYGLTSPHSFQHPKALLFNSLYSAVGVKGYMGPFAAESHLNADIPPHDYPSVYAHELAHLLSVSNEAEANFWAYQVCIKSTNPTIRFSAYYGIIHNVFRNAKSVLSEDEFNNWQSTLNPHIIQQLKQDSAHWLSLRNPFLDQCQTTLFNWFLKSNNIPSGTKNYDQVVKMIIATKKARLHIRR